MDYDRRLATLQVMADIVSQPTSSSALVTCQDISNLPPSYCKLQAFHSMPESFLGSMSYHETRLTGQTENYINR